MALYFGGVLKPATFVRRLNRFAGLVFLEGRTLLAHIPNSGRMEELLRPGTAALVAVREGPRRASALDLVLVARPVDELKAGQGAGVTPGGGLSTTQRKMTPAENRTPNLAIGAEEILTPLSSPWVSGSWVSIDARLPARLLEEALVHGRLLSFGGYRRIRREIPFGASRLDLLLEPPDLPLNAPASRTTLVSPALGKSAPLASGKIPSPPSGEEFQAVLDAPSRLTMPPVLVETKSVTLVRQGRALFPDAPTERGRRHLEELIRAHQQGWRTAVVFVIQRDDAHSFSPNDQTDPLFSETLRRASRQGVELLAYSCSVTPSKIEIARRVPVIL